MNQLTQTALPYPIKAHHMIVQKAIVEMTQNMKAPEALIATSFMTAMVIACQGILDVKLPIGQIAATTQNFMALVDSGERKSAIDRHVTEPIRAFDKRRAAQHQAALVKFKADLLVWDMQNANLIRQLAKAIKDDAPIAEIKERLVAHNSQKPLKPRLRRIMRMNATARAAMDAVEGDGESIAFFSAEGHTILSSNLASQVGLLNSFWDGPGMLVFDRAKGEEIIARDSRVTFSVMVQPDVWSAFLEKRGVVARGSGQFARYLFSQPGSTRGMRFAHTLDMCWTHLDVFHQRVAELLDEFARRVDSGTVSRDLLEFSPEAKALWLDLQNQIEGMLWPSQYMHDIPDFASKLMELTGRLAGTMHFFSGQEGMISVDTLTRAMTITNWHLDEFKRIFAPAPVVPQLHLDVQAVEQYLNSHYFSRGIFMIPRNEVLQNGPVRKKERFAPALDYLQAGGHIWIGIDPKKKRYINHRSIPVQATPVQTMRTIQQSQRPTL